MIRVAFTAAGLFGVKVLVSFGEKFFDTLAVAAINRNADAGGE